MLNLNNQRDIDKFNSYSYVTYVESVTAIKLYGGYYLLKMVAVSNKNKFLTNKI